jgi:hypothetical protein
MWHRHNHESSQIPPSAAASNCSTQTTSARSHSGLGSRVGDTKVHNVLVQQVPQWTGNDENWHCQLQLHRKAASGARDNWLATSQTSADRQPPTKVIGANRVPDLSAAIQLTRSVRLPDLSA